MSHDPVSMTLQYCQHKFPVYLDDYDVGPDLDVDELPWDYFPGIQSLRISQRERNDIFDGHLITEDVVLEVVAVLQTFVDHCRCARVVLDPHDGFTFEDVPRFARTCLILYILELRHSLPIFMAAGAEDASYPLTPDVSAELLGVEIDSTLNTQFLTEQSRFNTRVWEKGEHLKFTKYEILPLRSITPLGHGAQGIVDSVELVTSGVRYARKRWKSTNTRANQQFIKEIRLLRRLDPQRHIVEILGTYVRAPTEVGIVMMLADCDLGYIFTCSTEERRRIILDEDLRKGYGCLSSALSYMHSLGIRHKDIKPQNILIQDSQLIFTDFGVSRDISELTDSLTAGTTGTRKYKAPEFSIPGEVSGQAPADVFALGLVLLSIWSTLGGWQPEEPKSFAILGSTSPFYENMPAIHEWIEDRLENRVQPLIQRNDFHKKWDILQLRLLSRMVVSAPSERLRISEVVAILRTLSIEASFCPTCQDLLSEDEFEDVEMDWILDMGNRPTVDDKIGHYEVQPDGLYPHNLTQQEAEDNSTNEDAEEIDSVEHVSNQSHQYSSDEPDSATFSDPDTQAKLKTAAEGTVEDMKNPIWTPSPPSKARDSATTLPLPAREQRIIFVDCYGRRYPCPYHSINTWVVRAYFFE
jgi:serine/threonine protein kinase